MFVVNSSNFLSFKKLFKLGIELGTHNFKKYLNYLILYLSFISICRNINNILISFIIESKLNLNVNFITIFVY
jgi:hypothetical protein